MGITLVTVAILVACAWLALSIYLGAMCGEAFPRPVEPGKRPVRRLHLHLHLHRWHLDRWHRAA